MEVTEMNLTQQQSDILQRVSSDHINYIYGSHYNLDGFLDRLGIHHQYQKEYINSRLRDSDDDGSSASVLVQIMIQELGKINKNKRIYPFDLGLRPLILDTLYNDKRELVENEYRKFIEENRFKGIKYRSGQISIPRIQCTTSNGNTIKYASRRFPNDMVK